MALDLRKPHVVFGGGEGLRPVVVQNGQCYAHDGTLLPSDPQALAARRFSVSKDLRRMLLKDRVRKEADLEIARIQAQLKEQEAEALRKLDERLLSTNEMNEADIEAEIAGLLDVTEDSEEEEVVIAVAPKASVKKVSTTSKGVTIKK